MESCSAQAAAPNERRVAGAVGRVGDLGRLFRVVARDDRIGGLAPRLYCAAVYLFVTRF